MAIRAKKDLSGWESYNPDQIKPEKTSSSKTSSSKTSKTSKTPVEPVKPVSNKPRIRRNEKGDICGIIFPDGRDISAKAGEVKGLLANYTNKQAGIAGSVEDIDVREEARKKAAAPGILEEAGVFEEVTPTKPDLQPETQWQEGIPLFGSGLGAIENVLVNAASKGWMPGFSVGKGATGTDEYLIMTDETMREAALREIKKKNYEKGVSLAESFGTLIEAVPVAGSLARTYANGLTQTPSGNADKVIDEINKIKEAASTGQEKVRNGLEDPEYGLTRARSMEENLARLEGRLKSLINTSAILRSNSDEVNKIEEQILEAQEKVSRYRIASTYGFTAQITGTGRVIPTDEALYMELKELND